MSALCAFRRPDGHYCQRHVSKDSRFCYRHQPRDPEADTEMHKDFHPLVRLATPGDIFNVVREALNAARQGRISPGQAYAVGYLAQIWLDLYGQLDFYERKAALERQFLTDIVEDEAAGDPERAAALLPAPTPSEALETFHRYVKAVARRAAMKVTPSSRVAEAGAQTKGAARVEKKKASGE